jgi:hypothetical protein
MFVTEGTMVVRICLIHSRSWENSTGRYISLTSSADPVPIASRVHGEHCMSEKHKFAMKGNPCSESYARARLPLGQHL